MRAPAPFANLAHNAAGDVIARQQLRRPARVPVALRVAPALIFVVGGLRAVVLRNVVEHEAAAVFVLQDAAFAAHSFGDENAPNAGRPDHARRMELHKLHVHQRGARVISQRVPVARIFPAIAGDLVSASDAARGKHHGFGPKEQKAASFALVAESAGDAAIVFQQGQDGALHVDFHAEVNTVILQRADHFEAGAIAHMRQPRIPMAAEIALQNAPVFRAVEQRAPGFQLADAVGRFFRVQLRHAPVC